jgi:DNA (cytosine-5)-methyltransferase 1
VILLDAFSCAGLGADGYRAAGFEVVCLDNDRAALRHAAAAGFETVLSDATTLLADAAFLAQFDVIHASPPCQLYSATRRLADAQGKGQGRAVDLLDPTIALLEAWGGPYVVENVERSPLRGRSGVVRLCGSAFGLKVQRHRLFLAGGGVELVGTRCQHLVFDTDPISGKPRPWGVYYAKGDSIPNGGRTAVTLEHGLEVMGVERVVPWRYLCEGLPPAMTEHLGRQIIAGAARETLWAPRIDPTTSERRSSATATCETPSQVARART